METVQMPTREERIEILTERWGPDCFLCKKPFEDPADITLDHWYPQSYGAANGWKYEKIWDISNLRLAHKKCNARKGDLVPIDDYTLPERSPREPFRTRAVKRAERPEVCRVCNSGRDLGPNEICGTCGSGPMPLAFPQFAKVRANECDHDLFWCWCCSIGIVERQAAIVKVLDGEYLD